MNLHPRCFGRLTVSVIKSLLFIEISKDMMYLGTGHKDFGADMNIRGGQKGFMRSLAEGRFLAWPDYVGHLGEE